MRALLLVPLLLALGACRSNEWAGAEATARALMAAYDEGMITPADLAAMEPEPIVTYQRLFDPATGRLVRETRLVLHADGPVVKHGRDREWYPDGTPKLERSFHHGAPSGRWRTWHANGQLESEQVVEGDAPVEATWWYPDGTLAARGPTVGGRKHGAWTHWHRSGQRAEQGRYANGQRVGRWSEWYEDGAPAAVGEYLGGTTFGGWTRWTRDGDRLGTGRALANSP